MVCVSETGVVLWFFHHRVWLMKLRIVQEESQNQKKRKKEKNESPTKKKRLVETRGLCIAVTARMLDTMR